MAVNIPSTLESTYAAGETTDVPLGSFLERPVEIFSQTLVLGTRHSIGFNPWSLFVNDPLIKRRIEGFKHLRGTLKLRFVMTGNPMLFGRYIAWYIPRHLDNVHAVGSIFNNARYIQATQHPHIFLDPSKGEGGEMELPFFCPDNWLDLSCDLNVFSMGIITLDTIAPLRHANSAAGNAYLKVYAYMDRPEICAPTGAIYGSWVQQASEFSQNPISKPASAIARGAGLLSRIPMFAPYALATETVANAIGSVASIFGYSRPAVLTNIEKYRELTYGEMAVTNTHEVVQRLALDVKSQLTVDPRTVGLPAMDEMALEYIVTKDTLFQRFDWEESDASGTILNMINVTPCQFSTDTTTTPARSALTPQAAIAQIFRYWKGTIIYRFHISASALHRGKIRITYDPVGAFTRGMNQVYSRIIDIETCRDFEIPVHWHAMQSYLQVPPISPGSTGYFYGSSIPTDPNFHNGLLTIEVLNELTSPDPSLANPVQIDVSHRMSSDFDFGYPDSVIQTGVFTFRSTDVTEQPQSAMEADGLENDNLPETGEPIEGIGAGEIQLADHTAEVFMGETIKSLRPLLRRYIMHSLQFPATGTFRVRGNMLAAQGVDLHEYIMSMYCGWRGSTRFRFTSLNDNQTGNYLASTGPAGDPWLTNVSRGARGVSANRGALAVEAPFYYNRRFTSAKTHPDFTAALPRLLSLDPNFDRLSYRCPNTNGVCWYAKGEDFNLFFFTGLPLVY